MSSASSLTDANPLRSLRHKLLNCPKSTEKHEVQEVYNALMTLRENDEEIVSSDLEFVGMLFIEKLLDCYTHSEMEVYLKPLLDIYKKHLNHHILHEVGERVLVYLDSHIHDLRKEQLVKFYLKLLQHGAFQGINVENVFPLSEMTLFKVMDYILVCKNKLLQKSVLQIFHMLLPPPSEGNKNAQFFPNNASMQNAMWQFKSNLFESAVIDFMNYLNSQQDQVFHLNTILIGIGSKQYGKDERNERTYIDFNCSQRFLVCNILSEATETPVSIKILESNIEMIFAKEMPRLRAAEIRVDFTAPQPMEPLHPHAVKFIKFRFFTQFIKGMEIYKTDSFLTRFFGSLADFKNTAQAYIPDLPSHETNVKSVSSLGHHLQSPDKWDLSSVSLPLVSDRSRYTYNDGEKVLGTSLHYQSLSSNTNVTYSEFVAPCASTPDQEDKKCTLSSRSITSRDIRDLKDSDIDSQLSPNKSTTPDSAVREEQNYVVLDNSSGSMLLSTEGSQSADGGEEMQVQSERINAAASFSCTTYLEDNVSELSSTIAFATSLFSESTGDDDMTRVRDSQPDATNTTYYSIQSPDEIAANLHDPPVHATRQMKSILKSSEQFPHVPRDESLLFSAETFYTPLSPRHKVLQKRPNENMDVSVYTDLNLALSSCDGSQQAATKYCADNRGRLKVKSPELFGGKKSLASPCPRFVKQPSADVLVQVVVEETANSVEFSEGYSSAQANQSSAESEHPEEVFPASQSETYNMKDKLVRVLQNIVIGADVEEADSSSKTNNNTVDMDVESPEDDFVSLENDQGVEQVENVADSSADSESSTVTLVNMSPVVVFQNFEEDEDEQESFFTYVQYDDVVDVLTKGDKIFKEVEQKCDEGPSRGEIISSGVYTLSTNIEDHQSAGKESSFDRNEQRKGDQIDGQIHLSTPMEIDTNLKHIETGNLASSLASKEVSFNEENTDAVEENKEDHDSITSAKDDISIKKNHTEEENLAPLLGPEEVPFNKENTDAVEENKEDHDSITSAKDDISTKENHTEKENLIPPLAPQEVSFNKESPDAVEEGKENQQQEAKSGPLDDSMSSTKDDIPIKKNHTAKENLTPSLAPEEVSFNKENPDAIKGDKENHGPVLDDSTEDDIPIKQNHTEKENLTPSLASEVPFNKENSNTLNEDEENHDPVNYPALDASTSPTRQKRKKHWDGNKNRRKKKMNRSITLRRSARIHSNVKPDWSYSEFSDESMEIEDEDNITNITPEGQQEEEFQAAEDVQDKIQSDDMQNDSFNLLVEVASQAKKIVVPTKLTDDKDDDSTTSRFFAKKINKDDGEMLPNTDESAMIPCAQIVASTPKASMSSSAVPHEENLLEEDNNFSISSIRPLVASTPKAPKTGATNAEINIDAGLPSSSTYFDSMFATMQGTYVENREKSLRDELFRTPRDKRLPAVPQGAPKRKRYSAPPAASMASYVPLPENNLEEKIARRIKYGLDPAEKEAALKSMARIRNYLAHNEVPAERRPRQRKHPPDMVSSFLNDLQSLEDRINE